MTDGVEEEAEDVVVVDKKKGKTEKNRSNFHHPEGRGEGEEGRKNDTKMKKSMMLPASASHQGDYQNPPLYHLDQDEDEQEVFGIEEEEDLEGSRLPQEEEEEEEQLMMFTTGGGGKSQKKKSNSNSSKKGRDTPQTDCMHRREEKEKEEEERRTPNDVGVQV